jgi:hypothetical protein
MPERLDQGHSRRLARRQVARDKGDAGEHAQDDREGDRIGARGLVQKPGQGLAQQQRERRADGQTRSDDAGAVGQDQPPDVARLGSERRANSNSKCVDPPRRRLTP